MSSGSKNVSATDENCEGRSFAVASSEKTLHVNMVTVVIIPRESMTSPATSVRTSEKTSMQGGHGGLQLGLTSQQAVLRRYLDSHAIGLSTVSSAGWRRRCSSS